MAARYPGWYRTMDPAWATATYDFPADPAEGETHVTFDGAQWQFGVTFWECMEYATICMCCGVELEQPREEYCSKCDNRYCRQKVREIAKAP